ncbi:MAG TPA: hypothetical protein GXZ22_08750 [Clostridiaceae bacterium]|nr:hypothetical protein [Clostridiaceae bacterium]
MKPSAIIAKTFPFMLIRLLAYLVFFIGICIYTAIVVWILGAIQPKGFFAVVSFALFGGGGWAIYRFVRDYINYMIKAAHVAVIADMAIKGGVPEGFNMYNYGVSKVKKFFVASNVLFAVDRLVSGSVKQIQRVFGGIGEFLKFIPGVKALTQILNMFVDIILNYLDECIMGYIFLNEGQNVWKSAADGVVLYAQNWKTILKTGAKILVFLIIFFLISFLIFNGVFVGIFNGIDSLESGIAPPIAWALTIAFVLVLKWAILDSIIMIYMMTSYLKVAYGAEPSYDLYGKLQGMSKKFKELFGKSQEAQNTGATPVSGTPV